MEETLFENLPEGNRTTTELSAISGINWRVLKRYDGPDFHGVNYWNGKDVVEWVIIEHKASKWWAVGYYHTKNGITFVRKKDPYNGAWIKQNASPILRGYTDGLITIRGLHYQLVGLGMINSDKHYARVKTAMAEARRDGQVSYEKFADRDRQMEMLTKAEVISLNSRIAEGQVQVGLWMRNYNLKKWSNQTYFPEVWIEKKALIGAFEAVCEKEQVALCACKGYPSLTFLNDAAQRFEDAEAEGKKPIILYFGDHDPSGEDIPRSIKDNLHEDFGVEIEVRRCALMAEQVREWGLPPAPVKPGDSRSYAWEGEGQVELDAVPVSTLEELVETNIEQIWDDGLYDELIDQEREERAKYQKALKEHVKNIQIDQEDEGEEDEENDENFD